MKKSLLLSLVTFALVQQDLLAQEVKPSSVIRQNNPITFTENKGQVRDQNGSLRPDVLYGGAAGGMVYHLRRNGISFQQYRQDEGSGNDLLPPQPGSKLKAPTPTPVSVYRLDVNWRKANTRARLTVDGQLPGYANFYTMSSPALDVKSYAGVTYNEIYNGIDLHFYEKNGELEYDFLVSPHADYKQIQLEIKGATQLMLRSDGSVDISTPFGVINEGAPLVYQEGKRLPATWRIVDNLLSFEIKSHDPAKPMIIDPVIRSWGSYFGGTGEDWIYGCTPDTNGDMYYSGLTTSYTMVATSGAHQVAHGGGSWDGFLTKFTSAGAMLWATYYGGTLYDHASSCALDNNGNIYLCGVTSSTNSGVISSSGSHQPNFGGGFDAFLVKFNSSGVRQWGTYYGGAGAEYGYSCATDQSGNVYACGYSSTTTGPSAIASGGHQNSNAGYYDCFLVKFNSSGQRQWGTFYGDAGTDIGHGCAVDPSGNVYMTGQTQPWSTSYPLGTPGSHQPMWSNSLDAFLVKFNTSGVRQWGTYYGEQGDDRAFCCATDANANVYIGGFSSSYLAISTAGSHQQSISGSNDGFLAKFNTSGQRLWGTYYGGPLDEQIQACATDTQGAVYIGGYAPTYTTFAIGTNGSHQPTGGGSIDGFLAKFDVSGQRQWGTCYGGTGSDYGYACTIDPAGNIYLAGSTNSYSGTAIATPGTYQPNYTSSSLDAFFAKFSECLDVPSVPQNATPASAQSLCIGGTTTLSVSAASSLNITWHQSATSTVVIGTGSSFTTPILPAGTTVYYAQTSNTCSPSMGRLVIAVNVYLPPTISVNTGSVCAGKSFTITPSGAATYTYAPQGPVLNNLTTTTIFTVTGTSAQGCVNSNGVFGLVTVMQLPVLGFVSSGSLICLGESAVITATGAVNYKWDTGETLNTVELNPVATTSYTVTGTAANGCTNTAVFTLSVDPCMGLNSHSNTPVSVYPNPSSDLVYINAPRGSEILILNALGQQVLPRLNIHDRISTVNMTQKPPGLYFVQVYSGDRLVRTEKILVK
jgi:hypothetical protein